MNNILKKKYLWVIVIIVLVIITFIFIKGHRNTNPQVPITGNLSTRIGNHPFGYFFNSGYSPETLPSYKLSARALITGKTFSDPAWRKKQLTKFDNVSLDRSGYYITISSEFDFNGIEGLGSLNKAFCIPEGDDVEKAKDTYRSFVERYDGDSDYGCLISNGKDCYQSGDGLYPDSSARENITRNPINNW